MVKRRKIRKTARRAAPETTTCQMIRSTFAFEGDWNRKETAYMNGTEEKKYKNQKSMTLEGKYSDKSTTILLTFGSGWSSTGRRQK